MKRGSSRRLREQPMPSSLDSRSAFESGLMDASSGGGSSVAAELAGRVLNGLDDVLIPGTAAQIAGHPVTNLLVRGVGVFFEQSIGAGDHPRGAESTLQAVLLHEAFLQS